MTINPLSQAQATTSTGTTGTSSTNSSGVVGLSSSDGIDTTFLNLLATELQTQDPTSPMDPTAMVGQMVSLNQLDQLIGIRELLTPASTSTSTSPHPQPARQLRQARPCNNKRTPR